jgi:hypothetical protein
MNSGSRFLGGDVRFRGEAKADSGEGTILGKGGLAFRESAERVVRLRRRRGRGAGAPGLAAFWSAVEAWERFLGVRFRVGGLR